MSWVSSAWTLYAAHSDKVNPIVAGLGGAALVWAAVQQARTATRRHYEQTRADQQRRITESFGKAVEQLSSDKVEVALGGIYTLERLAIEAIGQAPSSRGWRSGLMRLRRLRAINRFLPEPKPPTADPVVDLYWTVMETLTAFLRVRARWQEPKPAPERTSGADEGQPGTSPTGDTPEPEPATDIAAVVEVIRRRPAAGVRREEQRDWRLDLRATDLRGANLWEAHLERAILDGAHLEGAILWEAHLEGAVLRDADLEGADLSRAHLEDAFLTHVHLEDAELVGAQLEGAVLRDAYLEGAHLGRAILDGADLREATGLTTDQLDAAYGDAQTQLPDYVARPSSWPAFTPHGPPVTPIRR